MPLVSMDSLSPGSIPNLHRLIMACRSYIHSIRRPCHSIYRARMTSICEYIATSEGIPYLYTAIKACRGNTPTIWRPGDSKHTILFVVGIDIFAASCFPDLHCTIAVVTSGGNVSTVTRPGDAPHEAGVPRISNYVIAASSFPNLYNSI